MRVASVAPPSLRASRAEIALPGVAAPAAPKSTMSVSTYGRCARGPPPFVGTSARSARMPPSPPFSARITNERYLMAMTSVSAQNTSESTPSTLACVGAIALSLAKHSCSAKSGFVPMSP